MVGDRPEPDVDSNDEGSDTNAIGKLTDLFVQFVPHSSPQVLMAGATIGIAARLVATPWLGWSRNDAIAVVVVLALTPIVEWLVHRIILHAKPRTVFGKPFDPGFGHRHHHLHPRSLDNTLLQGHYAFAFQLVNAGLAFLAASFALLPFAGPVLAPACTAVSAAWVALLHYEWAHFMFHSGYRPRTRYYARLKRNHRLHHWRNEHHWLGITSNAGDRLLGTYASNRSDVPLSPTARDLGRP